MRWLLGGLVVSVVALLWVAIAVAGHVRQRRGQTEEVSGADAAALQLDELNSAGTDDTGTDGAGGKR